MKNTQSTFAGYLVDRGNTPRAVAPQIGVSRLLKMSKPESSFVNQAAPEFQKGAVRG